MDVWLKHSAFIKLTIFEVTIKTKQNLKILLVKSLLQPTYKRACVAMLTNISLGS